MPTQEYTSGSGNWSCPAGVTSVQVECWGGGGGGAAGYVASNYSSGGGGGGGEYSKQTIDVTPSGSYAYSVGSAGTAGTTGSGGNGGNSTFTGDSVTVTAHGGTGGTGSTGVGGGAGGTGSTNTTHYNGGTGGDGQNGGNWYGGGGGGSGGTGSAGNNGAAGSSGGTGASAVTGGYPGGDGGGSDYPGNAPASGYGGGGGGGGDAGPVCVDEDTLIWTERLGWTQYTDLLVGDVTIAVQAAHTTITKVEVHTTPWSGLHLKGQSFDAMATFGHGWQVVRGGELAWTTTLELQSDDLIIVENGFVRFGDLTVEQVSMDVPRWCPTTESGTWFARREADPFFTGDAVAEDGGRA